MPSDGFRVNAATMIGCGRQISGLSDRAGQLGDNCDNAEVPSNAWGLVGQVTRGEYQDMLGRLRTHLGEISEGISSAGEKIAECGQDYQDSDRAAAEKLRQILRELGKVRA